VRFMVEWRLFLLLAVGAMAGGWVAVSLQRRRHVVRFTNVELLDVVVPRDPGWRRHAPPVLFLLALAALVIGFAEPVRATRVADDRATVILAIDTSRSMEADDVDPNRLVVAQEAARDFVAELPAELNVGLVTFNGTTTLAVPPGRDREVLIAAIDAMKLGESTAIGEAIFTSLEAVAAAPAGEDGEPAPGRIVLMSDGKTTVGRDNAEAAAAAAEAAVPVHTIAFGTPDGYIENELGEREPVPVAPEQLAEIAAATGGTAFEADSLDELDAVYADIGRVVGYDEVDRDVSGWFVGGGLALLALTGSLSLLWMQRLP
jgi:Ca-activated chloride channel homolog